MDKPVFLIGFMGSGKTHWGAQVSTHTGLPFYDLDALIETNNARSVRDIFSQSGEQAFREIEKETLHLCSQLHAAIVATGGGTPCFFDNMAWMKSIGRTIYLKATPAILAERLRRERQFRPLLANVEEQSLEAHIEKLLEHREPFYQQASITLEQDGDESSFFKLLLEFIVG